MSKTINEKNDPLQLPCGFVSARYPLMDAGRYVDNIQGNVKFLHWELS